MAAGSRHRDLTAFFDTFCEAFATFRGSEVAALYHVPSVALRGDASVDCMISVDAIAGFFQRALDDYHDQGCRTCRYHDLDVVPIGERSVLGTVTWELVGADGIAHRSWRQSYNLIDVTGRWQVLTSTEHRVTSPSSP
jgi:hypothetical protein